MDSNERNQVVVAYHPADLGWLQHLQGHLIHRVSQWPRYIEPGTGEAAVRQVLARARVAVLLVGPELLQWRELAALLEAEAGLTVLWIPVRRCDSAASPLCRHYALLDAQHPLAEMMASDVERALAFVAGMLEAFLENAELVPALSSWVEPGLAAPDRTAPGLAAPAAQPPEAEPQRVRVGPDLPVSELVRRSNPAVPLRSAREINGSAWAARAAPKRPPVRLGASAPRIVKPGQEFTARFAAYHPLLARVVARRLRKAGTGAQPHLDLAELSWKIGTIVTVQLSGDGLEVSPARQSFVWEGQQRYLDFDVRARARSGRYDTRLRFDVSVEGVVLARLRLDLAVAQPKRSGRGWSGRRRAVTAAAPQQAFASYAAEDRARVLDRVAAIAITTGMDVFVDCLSLSPNQAWRLVVERAISDREIFMLFWSRSAAKSQWVEWEWRQALARKGLDAIQAHPLDPWPKAPLPKELESLHMGDPLMAVRAEALRTESRAP